MDRLGPKTQVRDRLRARLFRIVNKVSLTVEIGVLTNNLDAVFVCADRAIGTKPEKYRARDLGALYFKRLVLFETGMGNIVMDTNCEVIFLLRFTQLSENGLHHSRREFLR